MNPNSLLIMNPIYFRPKDDPRSHPDDPEEWENNALSNSLAWASYTFTPAWCQAKEDGTHWTVRLMDYLFTGCPCCMMFRGLTLGFVGGFLFGVGFCLGIWSLLPM